MGILIIILLGYLCYLALRSNNKRGANRKKKVAYDYNDHRKEEYPVQDINQYYDEEIENELSEINAEIEQLRYIKDAYTSKWMFSYNEKNAYYKLNEIAKKNNMILFAKVRLLDLVTPARYHPKYKTNLYKIQAKHVDFVMTTSNLVAKFIIELDDSSHDTAERKERDNFVDNVLTACGYKVLHTRVIREEEIQAFIDKHKMT